MSPNPDDAAPAPYTTASDMVTASNPPPTDPPTPTTSHAPPPPPRPPSADRRLVVSPPPQPDPDLDNPLASPQLRAQPDDIFQVPALVALQLLAAGVEALVRITGDIPPTPPPAVPHVAHMRAMQAEKESIVRNYSEKTLARMSRERDRDLALRPLTRNAGCTPGRPTPVLAPSPAPATTPPEEQPQQQQPSLPGLPMAPTPRSAHHPPPQQLTLPIDGVRLKAAGRGGLTPSPDLPASAASLTTAASAPPPPPTTPEPYVVRGADDAAPPLNTQHSAITRKFYSKKPPPIGISDYLLRIHRFCPMSTAVYLAASLYIHRLAVDERAVAVTKRNAHRLLLAGLRVATKALEDLSYPHAKVAKVGGVSELELARLEISFCFLCGFELVVGAAMLQEHWLMMKKGIDLSLIGGGGGDGNGGIKFDLRIPTQLGVKGRFSH